MFLKFPKQIHVVLDPNATSEGEDDLLAFRSVEEAMPSDDPTEVAEYKLVRVGKFRKQVEVVGKKAR